MTTPVWIFAYGSLIWRPGFPVADRQRVSVQGYARRFWRGSHDHRGTPGNPGRVVTLVVEPGANCHGLALQLPRDKQEEILDELDYREKDGYERVLLTVQRLNGTSFDALTWVACHDNPSWLGAAPMSCLVEQISRAEGLSGANGDYVIQLDTALKKLGIVDLHVRSIADGLMSLGPKCQP